MTDMMAFANGRNMYYEKPHEGEDLDDVKQRLKLVAERDRYLQALKDIIDPMHLIRRNLSEDHEINMMATLHALDNPEFYKNIARKAVTNAEIDITV